VGCQPCRIALAAGMPTDTNGDLAVVEWCAADDCKRRLIKVLMDGERITGIVRDDTLRKAATVDSKQFVWGKELSHFMKALKTIATGMVPMLRTVLSTNVELASGEDTP